ncbi:MAG: hypothetical protein ABFS32_18040 [Bacteroidota bacterium]
MILQALTILLAVFLILVLLRAVRHLADTNVQYEKLPLAMTIFIAIWLIYLSVLSYTEILTDFSLPPKMPLIVVLPLLVMIFISLFKKGTTDFVAATSVSWLIYIQSYRIIVELIIWGAYKQGIVPVETTFEGQNLDILVGLTAVPLAYYAKRKKVEPVVLLLWNIASLLILANTVRLFITAAYFPAEIGQDGSLVGPEFAKLPYLLIAGLFMPLAVYIHALSIKQLVQRNN